MEMVELAKFLEKFYPLGARQNDGIYYKASSLKSIRSRSRPIFAKPGAEETVQYYKWPRISPGKQSTWCVCQRWRHRWVVHKDTLTREVVEKLYETGQLGSADSKYPTQLQNTVWFYISLYFGKWGRENQRNMTKQMIVLRTTPNGRQYYQINRGVADALPSTKNHQGGIRDEEDESNGKMFEYPGSA